VFGNLIVDEVVLLDGTTRMNQPGGAVIYAASARRVGVRGPVSRVATTTRRRPRCLGIARRAARRCAAPGRQYPSWILYEARGGKMVHQIGRHPRRSHPSPVDVPAAWFQAPAALVSLRH